MCVLLFEHIQVWNTNPNPNPNIRLSLESLYPLSQVHCWDPVELHDHLSLRWGKVADMAVYDEQLVSSTQLFNVKLT